MYVLLCACVRACVCVCVCVCVFSLRFFLVVHLPRRLRFIHFFSPGILRLLAFDLLRSFTFVSIFLFCFL